MPHLDVTTIYSLWCLNFWVVLKTSVEFVRVGLFLFPPSESQHCTVKLLVYCTLPPGLSAWAASIGSPQRHYRVTIPSDLNSWSNAKDFVICHYNPIQQQLPYRDEDGKGFYMITSQDDKWEQFVFIMRTASQRECCYKFRPDLPSSMAKLAQQLRNKQALKTT